MPLFFKINSKLFSSPKKSISFRVKSTSDWSETFLVDAVGNTGTITSKSTDKQNEKFYEIGVNIQLSSNNLTKVIKLTPYYLLINTTDVWSLDKKHFYLSIIWFWFFFNMKLLLDIIEVHSDSSQQNAPKITLNPNTITPFWPKFHSSKKSSIRLIPWKADDKNNLSSSEFSASVWYNSKHNSVLKFKDNVRNLKWMIL